MRLSALACAGVLAVTACKRSDGGKERETRGSNDDAAASITADDAGEIPPHRTFTSSAEALAAIVRETEPRVLGFGEYHQRTDSAAVRSALSRFTDEMLDVIGATTSDVVLETWVPEGICGESEEKVGADVAETTMRPPETQNELGRLVEKVRAAGARPHVLTMRCDDYESLLVDGGVDYEKLLGLLTRELHRVASSAVTYRANEAARAGDGGARPARGIIAVYGGSLHNDRYPYESVAAFSYATRLVEAIGDGYVEVDLYVPEYVAGDELLASEPWYPLLEQAKPDEVTLIERGPRSYILLLRRGLDDDGE